MSNQTFLLPANSKKSGKYFGFMNELDIVIAAVGIGLTFILLMIFKTDNITNLLIIMFPMLFGAFLVFPVPNYHNIRSFIYDYYKFLTNRREYVWRGWCYRYEWSKK